MPGSLPVLNQKALDYAIRFALAVNTNPQNNSYFERKHYFYPDLPKGYQITQLQKPIVKGGYVEIYIAEQVKKISLDRIQLEEDAGKNMHAQGSEYSLVDLNRAGTPLLEIVSNPVMHTAEEAKKYARELYLLARYTAVSDADMYHGNMRFDVNVSVSKKAGELGTRTETKNLNSFRSVERAVIYEIDRQIELLEKGQVIVQETRGFDEAKQKTIPQRSKEEAHDYRYFPDPDLPPVVVTPEMIDKVGAAMPLLPGRWRKLLKKIGLDESAIETLIDFDASNFNVKLLPLIELYLNNTKQALWAAKMAINIEIPIVVEGKLDRDVTDAYRQKVYDQVYGLSIKDKISSTNAKVLISQLLTIGIRPKSISKYAEEQGYLQVSDEAEIDLIVKNVINANPDAAKSIKQGELKAIGFLIGQVMQQSQGRANPSLAQKIIKKRLGV